MSLPSSRPSGTLESYLDAVKALAPSHVFPGDWAERMVLSEAAESALDTGTRRGMMIDKLKGMGVKIETMETPGGHEWANWRLYLHEIAPKLFR